MRKMKFFGMFHAFKSSLETRQTIDYTADELLAHLVDAEWDDRQNRRIERQLVYARFRYKASVEDVHYHADRSIDRNQIMRLAECTFIDRNKNLLITGSTGIGKSFAGEYIREHYTSELMRPEVQQHFQNNLLMGMEFDPTMIRIGAMNLILHGIENPNLLDVDSLSEANTAFNEQASIVLANPPFKGSLDQQAVDPKITNIVDSKKTELLFLGLILKGLKVGGRAAS